MTGVPSSGTTAIRIRIEEIRGMCTDEAPHIDIDAALGEVLDIIDDITSPDTEAA
jgi:hypothetical protein